MAASRTARLAALAGAFAASAAGATEYVQYLSVPYAPIAGETGCEARGLLSLPPAWTTGDAAALVLARPGLVDARRDAAVAALLVDGAAVLEIIGDAEIGCGGARRAARDPRDSVVAALAALREQGAGLVVALGFGEGTEAVLAHGTGVAASAIFVRQVPVFSLGSIAAVGEGWSGRSALLCAILSEAAGHSDPRRPDSAGIAEQCRAALGRVVEPVTPIAGPAPWPR